MLLRFMFYSKSPSTNLSTMLRPRRFAEFHDRVAEKVLEPTLL